MCPNKSVSRMTDRTELLERGLGSQVRLARQGTRATASATNGTADIGSAGVPEGTGIPHGDSSALGQRGDSERRRQAGRPGEHSSGFHESHTSHRDVPVNVDLDRHHMFR